MPKQHGCAERWPSWAEHACRVTSPPDVCVPSALTRLPDPISAPLSLISLFSICPPPLYLPFFPYLSVHLVAPQPPYSQSSLPLGLNANILLLSATPIFISVVAKKTDGTSYPAPSFHPSLCAPPLPSRPVSLSIQPAYPGTPPVFFSISLPV